MIQNSEIDRKESKEIDLIQVFRIIWAGKKTIYKFAAAFLAFGLIIILGSPKEYESEIILLAEANTKDASGGLLSQIGGMTGINLGNVNGSDALTVDIYPLIVKSTPFLLELLNKKVYINDVDKKVSLAEYLDLYTKPNLGKLIFSNSLGLPEKLFSHSEKDKSEYSFSNVDLKKSPFLLSKKQIEIVDLLKERISIDIEKSGNGFTNSGSKIIKVSIEMQDPLISAQITDSMVFCLKRYIVNYYTGKAKMDLQFIDARYKEAYSKFTSAQQALANYKDQNNNVVLASVNANRDRLQSEYNLAFNVFNTISQQLEQAKIKVQDQTPVFTIINPPEVPLHKSKPHGLIILSLCIFLSLILGICTILFKNISLFLKPGHP